MKYIFAGNRKIAIEILQYIISRGFYPEALMITDEQSDINKSLIKISGLPKSKIFIGSPKNNKVLNFLVSIELDYIFGIHYPYIISKKILSIPNVGFLNLHPAYLPYNRGWHTPSWSIIDNTPIGATLHFMSEELDMGDIINRKSLEVDISDTADSLYQRILKLEVEVFKESFDSIIKKKFNIISQNSCEGTSHKKKELFEDKISLLDINKDYRLDKLLTKLRALTTNDIAEAAYFIKDGKKFRVQIKIYEE